MSAIAILSLVLSTATLIGQIPTDQPFLIAAWYMISLPIPLGQLYLHRRASQRKKTGRPAREGSERRLLETAERNTTIYAIIWGLAPLLFGFSGQDSLMFLTVVQVATCTGLAMMISPIPRIVVRFTLISLTPLTIVLLASRTGLSLVLGCLTPVLIGAICIGTATSEDQLKRIIGSQLKARQAKSLLQAALEAMPDAFAVYNKTGEIVLHNDKHSRWHLPEAQPATPKGETTFSPKDGIWFRHAWTAVPEIGTLSVHTDVSAQKEKEDALVMAKQAAEIANGARARFLSRMSHELRTPLNSILGFSNVLRESRSLEPELVHEYATFIQDSGQHLLSMVEDVIYYSKIGDSNAPVNAEPLSVKASIYRAIAIAGKRPGCDTEKSYNIRIAEGAETLMSDRAILDRTLAALISNAIKFSPGNPEIIITARLVGDSQLSIMIRDHGVGMTEDQISKAFSMFYQVDDTRRRAHDGAGLGLTLVQKLVKRIDAQIKIVSEPERGTAAVLIFNEPLVKVSNTPASLTA